MLALILFLFSALSLSSGNDSDFHNWTDIEGKQRIIASNSSDIDLTREVFYVSGKSVSSAKSANTAVVSASVNIGNATYVKSALGYKPSKKDFKKARLNSNTTVKAKPKRRPSTRWANGNGTHPVFLSLKDNKESPIFNRNRD